MTDHFPFLLRVATLAASRGDRKPAVFMLAELEKQVLNFDRQPGLTNGQRIRAGDTRQKFHAVAKVLARAPTGIAILPNPSDDPPQAYALAHKRDNDPLHRLKLSGRQFAAAMEIRSIVYQTTASLQAKAQSMEMRVDGGGSHAEFEFMDDDIATYRNTRYLPWHAKWNRRRLERTILSVASFVLAVVVDECSIRSLAEHLETPRQPLRRALGHALKDYG